MTPESLLALSVLLLVLAGMILLIVGIKNSGLWLTMSDFTWNLIQLLWGIGVARLLWELIRTVLKLIGG